MQPNVYLISVHDTPKRPSEASLIKLQNVLNKDYKVYVYIPKNFVNCTARLANNERVIIAYF